MNEFWRDKLDRDANKCYTHLLQGIRRQAKDVDCGNVSVDSIKTAYLAIYNDHPELFYLSSSPQIAQRKTGFVGFGALSTSCSVITTPIYSSKEIQDCERSIEAAKSKIKSKITSSTTDEEKVLIVAEYLVRNTVYEIDNRYNQNAASALCYGKAQCSGISKAFKLLMDYLGVYCISISGDAVDEQGNAGPHAWNIIKLADNYYHIDVTFMLGANMNKSQPLIKIYLFYDDDSMAENHTWDRTQVPKCCDKKKYLSDIERSGFILQREANMNTPIRDSRTCKHYSSLNQLRTELREAIRNKNKTVEFYLEIGLNESSDIARAVQNAFTMVATKESINCSFSVSVSQGQLVNIEINY